MWTQTPFKVWDLQNVFDHGFTKTKRACRGFGTGCSWSPTSICGMGRSCVFCNLVVFVVIYARRSIECCEYMSIECCEEEERWVLWGGHTIPTPSHKQTLCVVCSLVVKMSKYDVLKFFLYISFCLLTILVPYAKKWFVWCDI